MPADEYCPIINFEIYISKLNPDCDRLWQNPKDSYMSTDECWYQKKQIGRDSLSQFMPKQIGLSTIYTNHSVRATDATILGKLRETNKNIKTLLFGNDEIIIHENSNIFNKVRAYIRQTKRF